MALEIFQRDNIIAIFITILLIIGKMRNQSWCPLILEVALKISVVNSQKLRMDLPNDPHKPLLGACPEHLTSYFTDTCSAMSLLLYLQYLGNGNSLSVLQLKNR